MYQKTNELIGFGMRARDGEIGRVKDFLFDDNYWAIRHIVADTGHWLPKKRVPISPISVLGIMVSEQIVHVDLTKRQIEQCPSEDEDKPVSRQLEEEYYSYYGWPYYWQGPYAWGPNTFPRAYAASLGYYQNQDIPKRPTGDPHLRSVKTVKGYHIQALDDEFGHVEDFVFDEEDWVIRYLIVDTRNWWPGKKVLLSPEWLSSIDWSSSRIHVSLDRETIKRSPEYDSDKPITREYEEELHKLYHREPYWRRRPETIHAP